jgi:hypothetical protein
VSFNVLADRAVEAAARALFERDMARSLKHENLEMIWRRVAPEYREQARVAIQASIEVMP